eukprot:gene13927-4879_t
MHDMKNTQKDSQNSTQETARTSSTESESIDQYIVASESNPTGIMEFHRPAVSRGCIRQATFPNATPQTQMITYPPRQLSLPANPNADVNGLGQKPLTTSQEHSREFKKALNSAVSFVDSQSKILENSMEILAFPNVNTETYSTIIIAKLAMIVSFPVVAAPSLVALGLGFSSFLVLLGGQVLEILKINSVDTVPTE